MPTISICGKLNKFLIPAMMMLNLKVFVVLITRPLNTKTTSIILYTVQKKTLRQRTIGLERVTQTLGSPQWKKVIKNQVPNHQFRIHQNRWEENLGMMNNPLRSRCNRAKTHLRFLKFTQITLKTQTWNKKSLGFPCIPPLKKAQTFPLVDQMIVTLTIWELKK